MISVGFLSSLPPFASHTAAKRRGTSPELVGLMNHPRHRLEGPAMLTQGSCGPDPTIARSL